jgi:hypothetical protein
MQILRERVLNEFYQSLALNLTVSGKPWVALKRRTKLKQKRTFCLAKRHAAFRCAAPVLALDLHGTVLAK